MLLSEQIAEALTERQTHQIDKDWTAGVRKWWATQVGAAKTYPGRIEKTAYLDHEAAKAGGAAAIQAVERLRAAVTLLSDDLLINKGFKQQPGMRISKDERGSAPVITNALLQRIKAGEKIPKKGPSSPKVWREKVVKDLRQADTVLLNANSRIAHWMTVIDEAPPGTYQDRPDTGNAPGHWAGASYPEVFKTEDNWNRLVRSMALAVDDGAEEANKSINKVLRFVSGLVSKSDPVALEVTPDAVPDVVEVGGAKLIFAQDELRKRAQYTDVGEQPEDAIFMRKALVGELLKAKAMLTKRGLGFLWYGNFVVRPKKAAHPNRLGAGLGVGASYLIAPDEVQIFGMPSAMLVAHELGHRLWFKFMTQAQRGGFTSYFWSPEERKKVGAMNAVGAVKGGPADRVPAVSTYGGLHPEEDFAEVFAHYIDGRDLTSDQIERFKAFTKGKWKMEGLSRELASALVESASGPPSPEDPWRYFIKEPDAKLVQLSQLKTIRARADGIKDAASLMRDAYEGRAQKRGPIKVKAIEGTDDYTVLDGNSTTHVARSWHWTKLPVVVV